MKRFQDERSGKGLSPERVPIEKEVERYIEYYRPLRSPNYVSSNTSVLKAWAAEMFVEHNCKCVQQITTAMLQDWFSRKTTTIKLSDSCRILTSAWRLQVPASGAPEELLQVGHGPTM